MVGVIPGSVPRIRALRSAGTVRDVVAGRSPAMTTKFSGGLKRALPDDKL